MDGVTGPGNISFDFIPPATSTGQSGTIGGVTQDQMTRSGEELAMLMLSSMFPQLMTPDVTGNPSLSINALNNVNQQCINNLLNNWTQSNQEIAAQGQADALVQQQRQVQINQQQLANLLNMFPQLSTVLASINPQTPVDTVGASNNANAVTGQQTNVGQLAFQTSLLVSLVLSTGASASVANIDASLNLNSIVSSVFQAAPIATVDTSAAVALLASLFGPALYMGAMNQFVTTAANADPSTYPAKFAEALVEKTKDLINNQGFATFLFSTLPGGLDQAAKMSPTEQGQMVALAKIAFILSTLSVAYKAETGGGTASEVWAMATGSIPLSPNDPRVPLVNALKSQLGMFPLALQQQIGSLFSQISLSSAMDPITLLKEVASDPKDSSLLQA